jgi:hypothetical protein
MTESFRVQIQLPLSLSKKGKECLYEECQAAVAQLVEHLTNDPKFKGLNPAAAVT